MRRLGRSGFSLLSGIALTSDFRFLFQTCRDRKRDLLIEGEGVTDWPPAGIYVQSPACLVEIEQILSSQFSVFPHSIVIYWDSH